MFTYGDKAVNVYISTVKDAELAVAFTPHILRYKGHILCVRNHALSSNL